METRRAFNTVALHYLSLHDIKTATEKMRTGIFNLLTSGFGLDLSTEMPYHGTLTIFWMRTIADFNGAKNGQPLLDKVNELASLYDKNYPFNFHSREFLFSEEAKTRFVEGNL